MKTMSKAMSGKSMMQKGSKVTARKKMSNGGVTVTAKKPGNDEPKKTRFEKNQEKKIAKAKTKAEIAAIEGEGTVSEKRNNRADRVSKVLGTARTKTPRRVSTSNSTSTSTTDNRNSGNTTNTTNSGSTSGSASGSNSGATGGQGGAGGRSNSSSAVDQSKKSTTIITNPVRGNSPRPPRPNGRGPLKKGKQGMIVKPKAMYGASMKPTMMRKGGTKKK